MSYFHSLFVHLSYFSFMKKIALTLLTSLIGCVSFATGIDTVKRNGYTLIVLGNDPTL
jgi:hypothetical protein